MDVELQKLLNDKSSGSAKKMEQPLLFSLKNPAHQKHIKDLYSLRLIDKTIDALPEAMVDLFKIDFPHIAPNSPEFHNTYKRFEAHYTENSDPALTGVWVYFPWKKHLVHLPKAEDYQKLRTARNQFLIMPDEQQKLYQAHVALAGLSVGFSILNTIVLSGGGQNMRIADHDVLSITNLNRLPATACDLEEAKIIIAARRSYEMDPFQNLKLYPEGLTAENIHQFLEGADLYIEEMDNIKLKIDSRFKARELRIPVIMATDNGDNTIIDVERFDLEPDRPLFHGWVAEEILRNTPEKPSMAEKVRLANTIVGPDVTPRMQRSLTQVGTKLPAWPQLGNAATLSGAVTSYVARRILIGAPMPSGRYEVHLDQILDPDYHIAESVAERESQKEAFIQGFELLYKEEK